MFVVEIGDEILSFPSREEREKFLFRLYLRLLQKMLRCQQLQEALEWLWLEQQEEMQRLRQNEEAWTMYVQMLLQADQHFLFVPADLVKAEYFGHMARDWVVLALDFTLVSHRLAPMPDDKPPRG